MLKNRKIMQLFSQKNDDMTGAFANAQDERNESRVQFIAPKKDTVPTLVGKIDPSPQPSALHAVYARLVPRRLNLCPVGRGGNRYAFTLAEVLITLGIIGVVAAITLPAFMENVNSRVKAKRMENIHQKLSKVTDKMASLDVLQGQGSTENFITEMKKHMNIAKVCKNGELAKCWPTSTVNLDDGKTFDISQAKTGKTLKASTEHGEVWDSTMGIVTADGTSMIISYNTNCHYDANTQGLTYDNSTGKSSSLDSGCLAIVYDWNGGSRPNKLTDDVIAIGKAGGLGTFCAYKLDNLCIREAAKKITTPMTKAECNAQKSTLGIKFCRTTDDDYWAAAVAECGHVNKMFTSEELGEIAAEVYGVASIGAKETKEGLTCNFSTTKRATELGLPDPCGASIDVWSGEERDRDDADYRGFHSSLTYWGNGHYRRRYSSGWVLCKGE